MFVPLLAALMFTPAAPQQQVEFGTRPQTAMMATELYDIKGKATGLLTVFPDRVPVTKYSPKKFGDPPMPWMFEWVTAAYGHPDVDTQWALRLQVYSQIRKDKNDPALRVARMLQRLWDYNYRQLRFDHSREYNVHTVDVYLCWGGQAGGEQLFDVDPQAPRPGKVNTIYFYDLISFTDPVEMAREVAHEYGHASIPAVGGYKDPEFWANGFLGEKIFLTYAHRAMTEGSLGPDDFMGATKDQIGAWLGQKSHPLVIKANEAGPSNPTLASETQTGLDAYMGLALLAYETLPARVFSRSLQLIGSQKATDYAASIALAAEEPEQYTLRIPSYLKGSNLWVPLGKGILSGGKILKRQGAWALVKPGTGPVVVVPRRDPS